MGPCLHAWFMFVYINYNFDFHCETVKAPGDMLNLELKSTLWIFECERLISSKCEMLQKCFWTAGHGCDNISFHQVFIKRDCQYQLTFIH